MRQVGDCVGSAMGPRGLELRMWEWEISSWKTSREYTTPVLRGRGVVVVRTRMGGQRERALREIVTCEPVLSNQRQGLISGSGCRAAREKSRIYCEGPGVILEVADVVEAQELVGTRRPTGDAISGVGDYTRDMARTPR